MESDLSTRLRAWANTAEAKHPGDNSLCADAVSSSQAASAAASASIVCSHARELRGDSDHLLSVKDELEVLVADRPGANSNGENSARWIPLPLKPGNDTVANLVLGAAGIPAMKSRNG
jgi:hypothetical protein